jgi:nucleoside transporter
MEQPVTIVLMNSSLTVRFCIMMFLQFFIWGVWYVPMWPYLGILGVEPVLRGTAYAATGVAAMISPFIVGMIADRFFSTQKVFGFLHLVGGISLLMVGMAETWDEFYPYLLIHLVCYMPTLALSNSLCFQNMSDPQKQFPPIRTLGTIGWIASGFIIGSSFLSGESFQFTWPSFLGGDTPPADWKSIAMTSMPFQIGAFVSIVLGLYSFSLPDTPPKLKGKSVTPAEVLGLKAFRLMKDPSFAVFIICSFLVCIPLSFYFQSANGFLKEMGVANSEGVMTLGQVSEIFFLLLIPFFFRKLGVKKMLIIGMLFWVLRYVLFAQSSPETHYLLFLGVIFHGICYDFFFVTGQLYVDKAAPDDIRSGAQGFIAFVTLGAGMFVGGLLNGWWNEKQTIDGTLDWAAVWNFPAVMAAIVLIIFLFAFKDPEEEEPSSD